MFQVDQLGGGVFTGDPLVEGQVRLVSTARREQIVLEQVGLSGDLERKRAKLSSGNLVQTDNFVDANIASATVNSTTSSSGVVTTVGGDFEDHLGGVFVGGDFVISDTSVSLRK